MEADKEEIQTLKCNENNVNIVTTPENQRDAVSMAECVHRGQSRQTTHDTFYVDVRIWASTPYIQT